MNQLELMNVYWQEATDLTADLLPDSQFSTPQLVDYLNHHLPSDFEHITKTKVTYLHKQGMLDPSAAGGEKRTSWRYTPDDVRRVVLIELLKTRTDLSVQGIKGLLRSFEEAQRMGVLSADGHHTTTNEIRVQPLPEPVSLAYALLRNRTLGTLITTLSGEAEVPPLGCLIAIRALNHSAKNLHHGKSSWNEVCPLLEKNAWYLAASDAHRKLYVYKDIQQFQNERPKVAQSLPQYHWYNLILKDTLPQFYEVILGLPELSPQQPSVEAIDRMLARRIEADTPFDLSEFPGLTTLLRAAFVNQPQIEEGTTLSALIEIIATASDLWDYCYVLVPRPSNNGEVKLLYIREHSSKFPLQLKGKQVGISESLSGWCYRNQQSIIVEPTSENDPRIAFFEAEGRPVAAAAFPAIAKEHRMVGVLYVARSKRTIEQQAIFSEELQACLKAFGYICGDIIARDQVEVGTVRSMMRLTAHPLTSYAKLEDLLQRVVDTVRRGISPEKVAHSWIYLLTLNIQTASHDEITQWLCQQAMEVVGNFLINRFWDPPRQDPLPIGLCKIASDQCVFAILSALDLPESKYKQRIAFLQQEMNHMRIGRLSPDFYPSAITFRYGELRQLLNAEGTAGLTAALLNRTQERLRAGPYLKRGHEALLKSDLDRAVSEFDDALRYVPNSWYAYKHLAEARMLQGTEKALEQAIETCQKALELNPNYASAHCLLADCLSYQGKFGQALIEYERTLALDSTRPDFLSRYGLALAGMTSVEYQEALRHLSQREAKLAGQRNHLDQAWLEAIDKFDQVRKLSTMNSDSSEGQRSYLADYHYHRGYAHLQASLINKAVEDFIVGRKLAPDDLRLAQAYTYALSLRRR